MTSNLCVTERRPVVLTAHRMLYDILLLITVFMFCLSLLLVHNVAVLENDFHNLQRDINLPLNLSRIEQVSGEMAEMTEKRKVCHPLSNTHLELVQLRFMP